MWTTWNFPGKRRVAGMGLAGILAGCALGSQEPAPDAPRAAAAAAPQPSAASGKELLEPVELNSVAALRLDEALRKVAGADFLARAKDPVAIEVETERPLGNLAVSSGPVIVLNGERLANTAALGERRLVAFLPDPSKLRETNTVAVVWVGRAATMSKRPLTFRRGDVRE